MTSILKLQHNPCPMCDFTEKSVVGIPGKVDTVFEKVIDEIEGVRVVRCNRCSGYYISPMIYYSDQLLTDMYNSDYFSSDFKNMNEKLNNMSIISKIMNEDLKGKTLLDLGSGTGEYLFVAKELGMDAVGMDVEDGLVENLREKHGFSVIKGVLSGDTFPPSSFDVVIFSHVIEHLQEPQIILQNIHNILKPNGVLLMSTPNADSFMEWVHELYNRLLRGMQKTFVLTPFTSPYHILGFNLKSARLLLEKTGFSPAYCKARSGLEWADSKHVMLMKVIKVIGFIFSRGMNIVTVSKKMNGILKTTGTKLNQ